MEYHHQRCCNEHRQKKCQSAGVFHIRECIDRFRWLTDCMLFCVVQCTCFNLCLVFGYIWPPFEGMGIPLLKSNIGAYCPYKGAKIS